MEAGDGCQWYLVKLTTGEFAIQYTGADPATVFPANITGERVLCLR